MTAAAKRDSFRAERKVIAALYRRAKRELKPKLDQLPADTPEYAIQGLIAQNVLRVCLETVLNESLPYDGRFLIDLGTRLAAYCVTAAHPEQTHLVLESIQLELPGMVENKQKSGTGIKSEWT